MHTAQTEEYGKGNGLPSLTVLVLTLHVASAVHTTITLPQHVDLLAIDELEDELGQDELIQQVSDFQDYIANAAAA